jgi:hypothetical protein
MISSFLIYVLLMLDGLHNILTLTSVGLAVVTFILFGICWVEDKEFKLPKKLIATIVIISSILLVLIPNTKQAAIIFGVPYLLEHSKDLNLDKVPPKLVTYVNNYLDIELDKQIAEIKSKHEKK